MTFVAIGLASGIYPLAVRPSVTSELTVRPAAAASAVLRPVRAISIWCAPAENRVMAVPSTPPKRASPPAILNRRPLRPELSA